MRVFSNQEVEKIVIDESLIKAISWGNQFEDLTVDIDWCGQEELKQEMDFTKINASLNFDFVTEVEFNLKFKPGTMGGLEITSFMFELKNKIWSIEFKFKFSPVGYFKFNCNNFKFIIDNIPTQM